MRLLENKTVVITGASRGIGRGIALVLAKHGANIAFTYSRSVDSAITLTEEITSLSVKCKAYQSNAANFEDSQKLIEQVLLDFETIDVLINNAAVQGPIGELWKNDLSAWREAIQVDLLSPVELCHSVVPWMKEQGGGSIINLSESFLKKLHKDHIFGFSSQ